MTKGIEQRAPHHIGTAITGSCCLSINYHDQLGQQFHADNGVLTGDTFGSPIAFHKLYNTKLCYSCQLKHTKYYVLHLTFGVV